MIKYILISLLFILGSSMYAESIRANVTKVSVKGSDNNYRVYVTLESDETGCEQYADWWEILSENGDLIYRRILVHSHPDMQPFTRSGHSVRLGYAQVVYIRAHMNKHGYVGDIFTGSVKSGFQKSKILPIFSNDIALLHPLPKGCLY